MIQLITCGPDIALNRKLTLLAHETCRDLQLDSETLLETLSIKQVPPSVREAESTTLCTMVYHRLPEAGTIRRCGMPCMRLPTKAC